MVDRSIVTSVRKYLRVLRRHGVNVRFGVIFGSHSRGQAHDMSDIDLLVVAPRFDRSRTHNEVSRLWRLAARTDIRIEPVPCGVKQWEQDYSSAIIEIARREGHLVKVD